MMEHLTQTLEAQGAFFEIEKKDVMIGDVKVAGKVGLVRVDDNVPLGIVSTKYNFIPLRTKWDRLVQAIEQSGLDTKDATANVSFANFGARVMMTLNFPKHVIEPAIGDITQLEIRVKDSCDGRWNFSVLGAGRRLFCLNGMTLADPIAAYSEYHNGNLDIDLAAEKVVGILAEFERTKELWEKYSKVKVSDEQAWRVFCLYANRPVDFKRGLGSAKKEWDETRPNLAKTMFEQYEVKERREIGDNAFGVLNTLTHHATHAKLRDGKEAIGQDLRTQTVERVLASEYWTKRVIEGKKH